MTAALPAECQHINACQYRLSWVQSLTAQTWDLGQANLALSNLLPVKHTLSRVWGHMPMIPALRKLRQGDHKFEASVYFILGSNKEEREEEGKKRHPVDIWVLYWSLYVPQTLSSETQLTMGGIHARGSLRVYQSSDTLTISLCVRTLYEVPVKITSVTYPCH